MSTSCENNSIISGEYFLKLQNIRNKKKKLKNRIPYLFSFRRSDDSEIWFTMCRCYHFKKRHLPPSNL